MISFARAHTLIRFFEIKKYFAGPHRKNSAVQLELKFETSLAWFRIKIKLKIFQ